MATVVGQGSAATTSVAIPAHQAGDMILVFARGTAAPTVPAAGGTVPAWTTLQSAAANSVGLTSAFFVATATNHTTGTWTGATHIAVLVLRPASGKALSTAVARSATGNGNNTQTIIYPALTLSKTDGTSTGVRAGTRGVADSEVGTNIPAGWTNQTIQPAGASALMAVHTRLALVANPTADSIATAGTNAAYRAHTIEVLEAFLSQNVPVTGKGSSQAFGTSAFTVKGPPQTVAPKSVPPSGLDLHIAGEHLAGQALVGWAGTQFGVPTTGIVTGVDVPVNGVPTAQAFGTSLPKPAFRLTVTGIGTAQSFGVVTPKAAIARLVTGIGTAQSFGAVSFRLGKIVGGVASAQNFGTPFPQSGSTLGFTAPGVPSAQQFGTFTLRTAVTRTVTGLGSAQSFGAATIRTAVVRAVVGVGSAQSFGTFTIRQTKAAGGVTSAQAFGVPTLLIPLKIFPVGVGSAQAFGTLALQLGHPQTVAVPGIDHGRLFFHIVGTYLAGEQLVGWRAWDEYLFGRPAFGMQYVIPGVPSAQKFGAPAFGMQYRIPGVPSAQQFGVPWIAYDQFHPVPGLDTAQAFGDPLVYRVYLYVPPTYEIILTPATCADLVLTASACTDVLLVPADWEELVLTPTDEEDLVLVPSVEE